MTTQTADWPALSNSAVAGSTTTRSPPSAGRRRWRRSASGPAGQVISADPQGFRTGAARPSPLSPGDRGPSRESRAWTPSALLEHLLAVTGYGGLDEGSEDREDVARRENIQELLSAREFERRNAEGATVAEYLDTVSLATNEDMAASGGAGDARPFTPPRASSSRRSSSSAWKKRFCRTASPPRTRRTRRGAAPSLRRNDARQEFRSTVYTRGSSSRSTGARTQVALALRRGAPGPGARGTLLRTAGGGRLLPEAHLFLRPPRTRARRSTTGRCAAAAVCGTRATDSA